MAFPILLGLYSPEQKSPSLSALKIDTIGQHLYNSLFCVWGGLCSQESVLMPMSLLGVSFDYFHSMDSYSSFNTQSTVTSFVTPFLTSSSEATAWHLLPCIVITCCGRG